MKTAKFYGSSDDLIEVRGVEGCDEFSATNPVGNDAVHGIFQLERDGEGMTIHALYYGCWSFAVGQVFERAEMPLPDWPIRIVQEHRYSVRLEVDVPDDVKVVRIDCRMGTLADALFGIPVRLDPTHPIDTITLEQTRDG